LTALVHDISTRTPLSHHLSARWRLTYLLILTSDLLPSSSLHTVPPPPSNDLNQLNYLRTYDWTAKASLHKTRTDGALHLAGLANCVYLPYHCRKHAFINVRLFVHTTRTRIVAQFHGFRMVECRSCLANRRSPSVPSRQHWYLGRIAHGIRVEGT